MFACSSNVFIIPTFCAISPQSPSLSPLARKGTKPPRSRGRQACQELGQVSLHLQVLSLRSHSAVAPCSGHTRLCRNLPAPPSGPLCVLPLSLSQCSRSGLSGQNVLSSLGNYRGITISAVQKFLSPLPSSNPFAPRGAGLVVLS